MQNIFNTIKTGGHSSLEKYTSHFIWKGTKGLWKLLSVRGELETKQNCNILTSQLFRLQQHFFPVLLGCSTGSLGTQSLLGHGSHSSIFSPTDLNFLSPGLYNNLTSTYFLRASQFALNSTLRQSRLSPDIFDRMHLLFTQVHFFFWQRVRGQYVTRRAQHLIAHYGLSPKRPCQKVSEIAELYLILPKRSKTLDWSYYFNTILIEQLKRLYF